MKPLLIKLIKRIPLYSTTRICVWKWRGRPIPPPHVIKQQTIKNYARKFNLKILVETGTHYGDMIQAMKNCFKQTYSIELNKEFYDKAKNRFEGDTRIKIIHGDSGIVLGKLVDKIAQPTLFWLDGHYSGGTTARGEKDTPIYEELSHIFNSRQSGHVIIIDDARCFGTDRAYPSIEELSDFILTKRPEAKIEIENDSIRITPY